jgi:hypothetical protein
MTWTMTLAEFKELREFHLRFPLADHDLAITATELNSPKVGPLRDSLFASVEQFAPDLAARLATEVAGLTRDIQAGALGR